MRLTHVALVALPLLAAAAHAQNVHMLYNPAKTQFATRSSTTNDDQIYFTQHQNFRNNGTQGRGWQIIVQDENRATSEKVTMSWHALENDRLTPKKAAISTSDFTLFGVGTGRIAFIYTLKPVLPVTLPQFVAMGVKLPKPHPWMSDTATLHYQRGDNTVVVPQLRPQLTYDLKNNAVRNRWVPGSTFHWGGLYKAPVCRHSTVSTAYGKGVEVLDGLESIFPNALAGDATMWKLSGDRYKSLPSQLPSFALVFLAPEYAPVPIPTPFGPILGGNPFVLINPYLLDKDGEATVGPIAVPNASFQVVMQAGFINFFSGEIEFANATKIKS